MKRGEYLVKIAKEKGYNLSSLAKKAGVPYTTVRSMVERNLESSSVGNLMKICKVLEVSIDDLFEEKITNYNKEIKRNYAIFKAFTYFQHVKNKEPVNIGSEFSSNAQILILLEDFGIPSEYHDIVMKTEVYTNIDKGKMCIQVYKLQNLNIEIQVKCIRPIGKQNVLFSIDDVILDEKVLQKPTLY